MTALVLGGAGYIGSHAVKALAERGHGTVVVDTLEKGHREAVDADAKFYLGDLRDGPLMDRVFSENAIDAVIDFAAYSVVAESVADPLKYYDNNVNGMIRLLGSMLKHGVNRIVFSSTAAVYGIPTRVPIVETDAASPISPYGETKLAVEKILSWSENAYGIRYVSLRYFNVAGAHFSGEIGEDHRPETHLIPIAITAALSGNGRLEIYGDDYATPDGTCIRDYVHVTDLADAHILAAEHILSGGASEIFNIGSGSGFSNREIADETERITGLPLQKKIAPRRPGDPDVLIASSEKLTRALGWTPKKTNLTDIIGSAYLWHKKHPGGYGGTQT